MEVKRFEGNLVALGTCTLNVHLVTTTFGETTLTCGSRSDSEDDLFLGYLLPLEYGKLHFRNNERYFMISNRYWIGSYKRIQTIKSV